MNQPKESSSSTEKTTDQPSSPRLRRIDRAQICWHTVDVEQLIEQDHSARAIWDLVGRLDLAAFLSPIGSVQGQAGRPAFDPQLLISLWLYAYSRGISSRPGDRAAE